MQMKFKIKSFLVKYILISFSLLLFTSCSVGYDTMQNIDKNRCAEMINPSDRQHCLNQKRDSYRNYNNYLEKQKSNY